MPCVPLQAAAPLDQGTTGQSEPPAPQPEAPAPEPDDGNDLANNVKAPLFQNEATEEDNQGLHPIVDIFDDTVDEDMAEPGPGQAPAPETKSDEESDEYEQPGDAPHEVPPEVPPEPDGPPPALNHPQRARLQQLLQDRDAQGHLPFN